MLRVAIVAESPRLRSELSDVLREAGRFEVVATAPALGDDFGARHDTAAALEAADVILTDAVSAAGAGTKAGDPGAAALVLLADEDELVGSLRPFRTGIALLPTTATAEQIVAAVEAAAAGLIVLHADHAGSLTAPPVDDDPLTPREREVLHMLAAGLGNKEIAGRLHISDHTAKFHVSQILAKLGAASRAEAVSIAMRRGLVPL
jgi:DNA-binding NarL/FixJ family response regulator